MSEMKVGYGYPRILCKWWLRAEKIREIQPLTPDGLRCAEWRMVVPWWAWPLELVHRAVFGGARIAA